MALRIGEERFAPSLQSTQDLLSRQLTKLGRPNAVHKKPRQAGSRAGFIARRLSGGLESRARMSNLRSARDGIMNRPEAAPSRARFCP